MNAGLGREDIRVLLDDLSAELAARGASVVMAGPGDETAAAEGRGDGHLRASHADREQVIGALKAAFAQGLLAKEEFDLRVSQAFASRTYAELAAVTADLPAEPTAARPPRPARTPDGTIRPGRLMVVGTTLYAGVWAFTFLLPWPRNSEGDPPRPLAFLLFSSTLIYLLVLLIVVANVIVLWQEKRSGGRPPRRPAPGAGGQAPRRPPSADPGGELPPVDRGHPHTAEVERSRPPRQRESGSRPPHRWRYRGRGYTIGYVGD